MKLLYNSQSLLETLVPQHTNIHYIQEMKQPFQHVQNICLRLVYCPTIIGHIKADLFIKNVIRLVSSRAKEFPKVVAEAEPVRAPLYTVYLEAAFLSTFILALTSSIIWSPKAIRNWSTPFILPDFLEVFIIKYGFSISIFSLILVFLISPIFNRSGSFEIDIYEITNEEAIRAKEGYQGGGKRRLLYDEPIKQGRFLSKLWSRRGELDIGNKSQYGKIPAAWRIVEDLCELVGKEEEEEEGRGGGGGGGGEEEDGNDIIDEAAQHEGRKLAIEELEELEKRVKEEEEEEELKEKERIEKEKEKERCKNNSNSPGGAIKRGRQSKR